MCGLQLDISPSQYIITIFIMEERETMIINFLSEECEGRTRTFNLGLMSVMYTEEMPENKVDK